MRSSYLIVLLALAAIVGCESLKGFMPAPSANKAVTVPNSAGLVFYGTADTMSLPSDSPGAYYVAEDDTSKVVTVFNVLPGQSSASALTPELKNQLDAHRKYRVYYLSNKNATNPTTIPMVG